MPRTKITKQFVLQQLKTSSNVYTPDRVVRSFEKNRTFTAFAELLSVVKTLPKLAALAADGRGNVSARYRESTGWELVPGYGRQTNRDKKLCRALQVSTADGRSIRASWHVGKGNDFSSHRAFRVSLAYDSVRRELVVAELINHMPCYTNRRGSAA